MKLTYRLEKKYINLILDFHVRWNSVYLMITRLEKFKSIVNIITKKPESIPGITNSQKTSIASLKLSNGEWKLVESLIYVLAPFYKATKMLSGRKYPTLALSFVIKKILHAFLSSDTNESESDSISSLKKAILPLFEYHLESKISNEQKETVLVNL